MAHTASRLWIAVIVILIMIGLMNTAAFERQTSKNVCSYSRSELLSMKTDEALTILLDMHFDICEPSGTEITYERGGHPGYMHHTVIGKGFGGRDQTQSEILGDLYQSLGGDDWLDNSGWNDPSQPICYWYGIECDEECSDDDISGNTCPVIGLWLSKNNAYGDIEEMHRVIQKIPFITGLDLSGNSIFGSLPDFQMPNLLHLSFYNNHIVGSIPDFKNITRVDYLELDFNALEGTIPDFSEIPLATFIAIGKSSTIPNFKSIPFVKFLAIYDCQLSGRIPDFTGLSYTDTLLLHRNHFQGQIPDFKMMPMLDFMRLSFNNLEGTVPNFSNTPMLSILYLHFNNLKGTIPNFDNIPIIDRISLYSNPIGGTLPDFIHIPYITILAISSTLVGGTVPNFRDIPNVDTVSIGSNQLTGTVPNFDGIPTVSFLAMSSNQLIGTLPSFSNIKNLAEIHVSSNHLFGTIPDFDNLPELDHLYLNSNDFSGNIPGFQFIPKLSQLSLYGNRINGTVPNFDHNPNLELLWLNGNQLEGTVPDFSNLVGLIEINLSNNKLSGSFPNISNLLYLEVLDISRNSISGTIPNLLGLESLISMSAYDNNLSGTIHNFENCPYINEIVLFRNKLQGNLPRLQLKELIKIDISENEISGVIPNYMDIPSIEFIDFSVNNMSGTVPQFFQTIYGLKSLSISRNKFHGTMPMFFWTLPNLISIDLSHNMFSGDVGLFMSPDISQMDYNYTYQTLILDDNQLSGELNWWIFDYVKNIKTLSLKNNLITKLGSLESLLKWTDLDVSGNPLIGTIPESYSRFTKISAMNFRNTSLNHGTGSFIPSFANYTQSYNLEDKAKLFVCPSIISMTGLDEAKIEMDTKYYDFSFCRCLPTYFGFGDRCVQCPRECDCSDGVSLQKCFASPSVKGIEYILPCPRPDSCETFLPYIDSKSNTLPPIDDLCETGYEGHLCSKCSDGYGKQGRTCSKCEDYSTYLAIILPVVGFALFIAYLYFSDTESSANIRVVLFHLQTLSILPSGLIESESASSFIDVSFSIGSIQIPTLACVLNSSSPVPSLVFSFLRIPVFLISGIILYSLGSARAKNKAIFITINMLFFIYYSIANEVFGVFGCTVYDKGEKVWFLNSYPWIECDPATSEYWAMLGMSIPVFLFFLVGFPIFVKSKITTLVSSSELEVVPNPDAEARYGFMYLPYKEGLKYWEFVIIARRIGFSFVLSVVPYTHPSIFFLLLVIIIQFSIWMQKQKSPYKEDIENKMELSSLYVIFFSFFLILLSSFLGHQIWITAVVITINLTWLLAASVFAFLRPLVKNLPMTNLNQEMVVEVEMYRMSTD